MVYYFIIIIILLINKAIRPRTVLMCVGPCIIVITEE